MYNAQRKDPCHLAVYSALSRVPFAFSLASRAIFRALGVPCPHCPGPCKYMDPSLPTAHARHFCLVSWPERKQEQQSVNVQNNQLEFPPATSSH